MTRTTPPEIQSRKTSRKSFIQEIKDIWSNIQTLPRTIRQIVCHLCRIISASLTYTPEVHDSVFVCTPTHLENNKAHPHSSAWIAWFPVLFYSTLYIGDFHKRASPSPTDDEARSALDAEATRLGSRALFFSALLSLFVNLALPLFVTEAASAGTPLTRLGRQQKSWWARITHVPRGMQLHLSTLWAVSHLVFCMCMMATLCVYYVLSI